MASRATCSAKPLPTAWSVAATATATKSLAKESAGASRRGRLGRPGRDRGAGRRPAHAAGRWNGDGRAMSVSTATSGDGGGGGVGRGAHWTIEQPMSRHSGFLQGPRGRFALVAPGDADGRLRRENPEAATLVRIWDQRGDLGPGMRVELRERRGEVRLDRALGEEQLIAISRFVQPRITRLRICFSRCDSGWRTTCWRNARETTIRPACTARTVRARQASVWPSNTTASAPALTRRRNSPDRRSSGAATITTCAPGCMMHSARSGVRARGTLAEDEHNRVGVKPFRPT